MLQIKKLLQLKKHCCKLNKFEIVPENFQKELLQIKTSEGCTRTEGRRRGY